MKNLKSIDQPFIVSGWLSELMFWIFPVVSKYLLLTIYYNILYYNIAALSDC